MSSTNLQVLGGVGASFSSEIPERKKYIYTCTCMLNISRLSQNTLNIAKHANHPPVMEFLDICGNMRKHVQFCSVDDNLCCG